VLKAETTALRKSMLKIPERRMLKGTVGEIPSEESVETRALSLRAVRVER
jgi:hypothetical protein